jgi:hypothetical protein
MGTQFAAETAAFPADRKTCSPGFFSPAALGAASVAHDIMLLFQTGFHYLADKIGKSATGEATYENCPAIVPL